MKKQRYTESQILQILKQAEGGIPVADLCREYGMSSASFYKWRSKYGGMDADFYFAHPYASWEREYQCSTSPKTATSPRLQEINTAMERLNNRPRKRLGYKTPNQLFFTSGVALHI